MDPARRALRADPRALLLLAASVAARFVGLIATIAWLVALAALIDRVFIGGADLGSVSHLVLWLVALVVGRELCTYSAEELGERAGARVRGRVRTQLTEHLLDVGPTELGQERIGEVANTLGEGVEAAHRFVSRYLPTAAMSVLGPLAVLVVVAVLDLWTPLILVFAGTMLILLLAVIGGRTRELSRRRFEQLGWLSSFYLDLLRGLGTLKAFGASTRASDEVEAVSRQYGKATMDVLRTAFQTSLVMEWAATAATALVAVEVSFRLVNGHMGFFVALAVLLLTPEFFVPFRRVAQEYHVGQEGRAALERIDSLRAMPATTHRSSTGGTIDLSGDARTAPEIVFEGVCFRYRASDSDVLHDFDLRLAAGLTTALVGPSGVGKTTVTRLLLRFVEPSRGRILVAGQPLESLDVTQWRRRVAWVPQDPTIIAGTVGENIALGDPTASPERVRRAAEVARAMEFIDSLPDGFDTVLGEQGTTLSGGQRQRLAIARAALKEAPVVIFDEYTAHLDERTEADILAAMTDLLRGRTALIVAHRASTIAAADAVVTLAAGRAVVPAGNP